MPNTPRKYTSAELLALFKLYAERPAVDTVWTDARIYDALTRAQERLYSDLALHAPHALVGAAVAMTTEDQGQSYLFGKDANNEPIVPFGYAEVYAKEVGGRTWYATSYENVAGDFVIERDRIRMPGGKRRTFSAGPFARFVDGPNKLDAATEPTLPFHPLRVAIVSAALADSAELGLAIDGTGWEGRYQRELWTHLPRLKTQFATQTAPYSDLPSTPWWQYIEAN